MRVSALSFLLEGAASAVGARGDEALLWRAIAEGTKGVGRTAPNPAVGAAVQLRDGRIITGFHARAGERHAEVVALDACGPGAAVGSTLACSLEPCVHHGRTPPCVDRILAEGVARVIIGALDENPVVRGRGVEKLRSAGVEVVVADGAVAAHARALAAPFFWSVTHGRPYVVLKIASTLDGRVATHAGASRWITGEPARALVHALRDRCDAVLVGAGTVRHDDPELTVRAVKGRDPLRVIVDRTLSIAPHARALPGAVVLRGSVGGDVGADAARADALRARGATLVAVPEAAGHLDLAAALATLGKRGVQSVLVEAGPGLATAFVRAGLVDELWWFQAPVLIGGDGQPALGALGVREMADAVRPRLLDSCAVGDDRLSVLGFDAPAVRVAASP